MHVARYRNRMLPRIFHHQIMTMLLRDMSRVMISETQIVFELWV